jgi:polygalacturonase
MFLMVVSVTAQEMFYNVLDYGARGDGITNNTKAITGAVDAAAKNGGGTVEFPAGTYLSGTIFMKNNVILNLQPGSKILGSKNIDDYLRYIDKYGTLRLSALIRGDELVNIGITGLGIIDGQGKYFHGIKVKSLFKKNQIYVQLLLRKSLSPVKYQNQNMNQ